MMQGYNWFERGAGMMRNGFCGFGYGSPFFGIWHILILLGVIALVAALVISRKKSKKKENKEDALEMIKIMFARGEITEEEYLRRKKVLEGNI
ncbi:MAG: SHOCT domain-containing protein [Lachnospiraceae bacterium]